MAVGMSRLHVSNGVASLKRITRCPSSPTIRWLHVSNGVASLKRRLG